MPNPGVVDSAQTYGWDTVFAMHIADVNAAIVAKRTSPQLFSQEDKSEGCSIAGTFSDWSLVPGGDGDLVCLELPFLNTQVRTANDACVVSGAARANVRLDLLHDEQVQGRKHLKVRTTPVPFSLEALSTQFASTMLLTSDAIWLGPLGAMEVDILAGRFRRLPIDTESTAGPVGLTLRSDKHLSAPLLKLAGDIRTAAADRRQELQASIAMANGSVHQQP